MRQVVDVLARASEVYELRHRSELRHGGQVPVELALVRERAPARAARITKSPGLRTHRLMAYSTAFTSWLVVASNFFTYSA